MSATPSIAPKSVPVRETTCCYCGASDEPMRGKDLRVLGPRTWRLAVACVDARACSKRAKERDSHLDEVWSLTPAGVVALAFIEQAQQLPLAVSA